MLRTGQRFGVEHLTAVLRGEATDAVARFRHDELPTFGVGADVAKTEWRSIFRQLYAAGLAEVNIAEYGQWSVTPAGRRVLKGEETIMLRKDAATPRGKRRREGSPAPAPVEAADAGLLAALKARRLELARAADVPAYVIFTDRTLHEIAAARPRTLDELAQVHGVGQAKLEKYGDMVLEMVEAG